MTIPSASLWFVILCLTLKHASGCCRCSCAVTHPQKVFCSSDFAFVGKVLNMRLIPGKPVPLGEYPSSDNSPTREYRLRLRNKLKEDNRGRLGRIVTIYTGENSASCGINLTIGKNYLLAGLLNEKKQKRVGLCDVSISESRITFDQMVYHLTRGRDSFIRNCQCKDIKGGDVSSDTGCKLPEDPNKYGCYFATALCAKIRNGCKWRNVDCTK